MCQSERKTSFPEYAIIYYLNKYGVKAIHSYREKGYELDVYISAKKSAIEYDGYLQHKNKTKKDDEKAHLEVTGDASFIEFLGIENNNGILRINVKNPTGSDTKWMPYNRGNYNKRNIITLCTGKEHGQIFVINYLDLNCYESEIADGVNQWIFMKESL